MTWLERSRPLKRSKPMARSRIKRGGLPRRVTRPGPGSDPAYLDAVRKLPCICPEAPFNCQGPPHAHHAGPKSNDSTAIPLCLKHHDEWHSANGWTKHWAKDARRAWAESAIAVTRVMLGWGAEHTAATTGAAK